MAEMDDGFKRVLDAVERFQNPAPAPDVDPAKVLAALTPRERAALRVITGGPNGKPLDGEAFTLLGYAGCVEVIKDRDGIGAVFVTPLGRAVSVLLKAEP